MKINLRQAMIALSLGAMTLTGIAATPALAQPGREYRRDVRDARQDYRRDVRDARALPHPFCS